MEHIIKKFEKQIVDDYTNGESSVEIAKKLGFSKRSILRYLKANNIQRRPSAEMVSKAKKLYDYNENYFSSINTRAKAYFLGFLYADGYNSNSGVTLRIHKKDIEIMQFFQKEIESNHKIRELLTPQKQVHITLQLYGRKISEDLTRLGCFRNKSLTLRFPTNNEIPEDFMPDFIRGYFDGDGCASLDKDEELCVNFTSSTYFCKGLKEYLKNKIKVDFIIRKQYSRALTISSCGFNKIKAFYDYIYTDSPIFLKRKKDKFEKFFQLRLARKEKFLNKKHSRFIGVSWHKGQNKWVACSTTGHGPDKKTVNLGTFPNELDAAIKYNQYAKNNNKQLNNI